MTKTSTTYTINDQKKEILEFLASSNISFENFIQVMDYLSHYTSPTDWAFVEKACLLLEEGRETSIEHYSRQKQAQNKKRVTALAAVAPPTQTNDALPNRGDNERGRVQTIAKIVSKPAQDLFKVGDRIMHNDKGTATIISVNKREITVKDNNNVSFLLEVKSFHKKGWEII